MSFVRHIFQKESLDQIEIADVKRLLENQIEESIHLDYEEVPKKVQFEGVSKQVSGFLNTAGGVVVFGVSERTEGNRNIPHKITWTEIAKETLEQHLFNRIENNYVVIKQNNGKYNVFSPVGKQAYKSEVFAVKCSKRGNDVYRQRVYRRFKGLASLADKTVFFNPKDRGGNKKTRALFVTLTYDTKLCSFGEAWKNIGIEFNRFMSHVRKNFGKVSCCRVFEAFKNGHPHVHCVLLFEEKQFKVFRDKKGQFRIKEKGVFAAGWRSHTDAKALSSLGRGLSYLKKYLLKSIDKENKDSKTLKTLALGWLFNKRAFSVSGKFRQMLTDLIKTKHNSNHKKQQTNLKGEILIEYTYYLLGFVPADVIRLKKDLWFSKLSNEQITLVDKFIESKKHAWD